MIRGFWHKGFLFLSIIAFALAGCGGGGGAGTTTSGSQGSVTVSGLVGNGYSTAGASKAAVSNTVDMVVAIPIDRGYLSGWSMTESLQTAINNAGSFSLSLTTDRDWLLLLINNSVSGAGRYVGSVALNTGSDLLLNLPATDAGISMLDLGTLSGLGMNAVSSSIVNGADFNLTSDQLTAMAKTSDIFHNAMNIVNNYNGVTGIWREMRPNFYWEGSFAELVAAGGSDPNSFSFSGTGNHGISFQLDTNDTSITMADICNGSAIVEFAGVSNTISSAGASCGPVVTDGCASGCTEATGNLFFASDAYGDVPGQTISYGMQYYFSSMPTGAWQWKINGSTVGEFDVAVVSPPVTAGGKPKGFVPSFKLTVDGNKVITAIDVRWYYYDEGIGGYVLLAPSDLVVLKHFLNSAEVSFDVTTQAGRLKWDCYFDPVTTTRIVPSVGLGADSGCPATPDTWYYNDPGHPDTNTGLMGFFGTGGFGYYFQFFVP